METIAVLMTCHNRRDTTLKCLTALYGQILPGSVLIKVYLIDDGCTDGTGDAVRKMFPDVIIIQGDGNLYWCGSMRIAWETASKAKDYDYYLWLNDDANLFPNAIARMVNCADELIAQGQRCDIVVGSCCDPVNGEWTYGGRKRKRVGKDISGPIVFSEDVPLECDTVNGNCLLVSNYVFKHIGNFSTDYIHGIADFDYGYRAVAAGFRIFVAQGYIGTCSKNPQPKWSSPSVPSIQRLKLMYSPKGLSFREYIVFCRKHTGVNWFKFYFKAYCRVIFPGLWQKVRRKLHLFNQ